MNFTKQMLSTLSKEDLINLASMIREVECDRTAQRKRELWGNVIHAIEKYEKEIGGIELADSCDNRTYLIEIPENGKTTPGILSIFE